jgi:hypothetical protein
MLVGLLVRPMDKKFSVQSRSSFGRQLSLSPSKKTNIFIMIVVTQCSDNDFFPLRIEKPVFFLFLVEEKKNDSE